MNQQPLITLALIGYNQERFIEGAIIGAFSQTYAPLEIILSDDCSRDATFSMMQDMAAGYEGGQRVILNRNEHNLGLAGHINRAFELAHGSLVVVAAGDDISLPDRVQVVYEAWERSHRKALCIYSGHRIIGADGQPLNNTGLEYAWSEAGTFTEEVLSVPQFFGPDKVPICGATAAWSPQLMEVFGPLPSALVHEDEALALRTACLVGPFMRVALPLVKYRTHDDNFSSHSHSPAVSLDEIDRQEKRNLRKLENRHQMYSAFIHDLETASSKSLISASCYEQAVDECRRQQSLLNDEMEFYESSFLRKFQLLLRLKKRGVPANRLFGLSFKLLPTATYRALKFWRQRVSVRQTPS